jgi:hypothetical protein
LHKHHEHPSTPKESSKDDASELGKVLNLGEAVISERSLRGMSNAELLKLTKMAKEILVEGKKNDKTAAGEGSLVGADVTSRRAGTPKSRGGYTLSDDSSDSRTSTPDWPPRRPQRIHPPPGRSSSRSRLITIVDEELSPVRTHNDDKPVSTVSDLNQSIDLDLWSLENSLIAERNRKNSVDAQKVRTDVSHA